MERPLVTVIMPVYNRADLVGKSLDSVLKQSYQNWECIVVDDGSTDNSKQIIQNYREKDDRIKYYYNENSGAAAARNYGIQQSNGIYILPLDSDDLITETYIEKAVVCFNENPEIKIVYGKAVLIGEKKEEWNLPPYSYELFLMYNMLFNSSMYKRSDFDRVGGYTEGNRLEDWDLWIKILKSNGKVFQLPEIVYFYRTHQSDSITTLLDEDNKLYKESMNQLYKNHFDEYLRVFGNPIDLERERRGLDSKVKTADFKNAEWLLHSKLFQWGLKIRRFFKIKK